MPSTNQQVPGQDIVINVTNFQKGLITDSDPANIDDNALSSSTNMVSIAGILVRRNGQVAYNHLGAGGIGSVVLNLFGFNSAQYGFNIYSFNKTKIYSTYNNGNTDIPPDSPSNVISGTDYDRFRITSADGRLFFTNGVNNISEIDLSVPEYKPLGNAPIYKYITSFFNRVIGANLVDTIDGPTQIGWSGDRNYDQFDPTVDQTAGFTTLVTSPADTDDEITGLVSYNNSLIILRERSVWIGNAQASGTDPFAFYSVLRVGADIPDTIVQTEFGLIWYNFQHSSVYIWDYVSTTPVDISGQIRQTLKSNITSIRDIRASYSKNLREYTIYFTINSTTTISFNYNFLTQSWLSSTYIKDVGSESGFTSVIEDIDYNATAVIIDQLQGTINSLVGPINSQGGIVSNTTRFFGSSSGFVYTQPNFIPPIVGMYGGLQSTQLIDDNGIQFASEIISKVFEFSPYDLNIKLIRISIVPFFPSVGTINVKIIKDDNENFGDQMSFNFTVPSNILIINQRQFLQIKQNIKCRNFKIIVSSSDCSYAILGYTIIANTGGVSQNGSL